MSTGAYEVDLAAVAQLIGDPSRAAMLNALMSNHALPAGELAYRAGISAPTASTHLARLVAGGLLTLRTHGRHRYFALAGPHVAHALEALALIAPPARVRSLRESVRVEQLHAARTCYDHLAGRLGVAFTEALQAAEVLHLDEQDQCYQISKEGERFLIHWGIDLQTVRRQRRVLARACLDWSERRYHLAGALGAAFVEYLLQHGWIERLASGRAVRLMARGQEGFQRAFGDHWHF